ncbi:hypothetical protein [Fusobacterium necrophorum]|uniref:Uncharacterized protein n=1 Tax=Fusobacterium necrophorum subsp. funduliforme TaxID=143387 RepID=A0A162J7T8_9FUSO|nr:hypothetical protein [Fusobacterium necrophorum]KYL05294.1 hypothetical protein A2J07_00735 [Fusobacterium necrophorum subsp. funduliforme]MDK4523119.1 hypothetical protein [Fusobacterium necrophorum]
MWKCNLCNSTNFYFEEEIVDIDAKFDKDGNLIKNKNIVMKKIKCNECGNETENNIKEIATFTEE